MPKTRRTYSRKKKTYKKRKMTLYKSPVPTVMYTKLRYHTVFNMDPAAGILAYKVFRANGLFDPEVAAGGHQPRGFDQLMALYDHYVCVKSTIRVSFATANTAYNTLNIVALRDSNIISANVNDYMEGGNVRSRVAEIRGGGGLNVIKHSFTPRFLGRTNYLADPQLKGSEFSDPTEQAFFHIVTAGMDAAVDPVITNASVVIDYTIALIEPKVPVQS